MSFAKATDYVDLLGSSGKIKAASIKFLNLNENSERVRFWLQLIEEFDDINKEKLRLEKSNAISESCRSKGNQFYKKKQFLEALSSYNESFCFAETGSKNIALAYANRSAVYCEMRLYEKCLKSIELAKSNHYPNLDKLKKREETCLLMINDKSELSPSNVPFGVNYLKLSQPANKILPFIVDCLEVRNEKDFGRLIITKTALQPGDVVCCEEPFVKVLSPAHRHKYCATCLKDNFLDLFPCNDCTSTMFCSEECQRTGQEKFHKFECPIIDELNAMCTENFRMALRTFFEALFVCDGNLEDLKALIEKNEDSSWNVFDCGFPAEAKDFLKAIDALSRNESKTDEDEIFLRAGAVAIVCDLFVKHTKLREILTSKNDEDFFYSFVFKHSQISECNFHGIHNGVANKSEVESNPEYGSGSFPFCSLLNHSCAPNLFRITSDCKNYVVISRPIPAGGQLFDNYGYNHCSKTLEDRQASLLYQYKFECSCEACEGNYPLSKDLGYKDFSFHQLKLSLDDYYKLCQFSFDIAVKNFKLYCDYLNRMDRIYPSSEISSVQDCFQRCFLIFAMSDFKLKLCEH